MTDRGSLTVFEGIPEEMAGFAPRPNLMTCREHLHHLSFVERHILKLIANETDLDLTVPETDPAESIAAEIENLKTTWRLTARLLSLLPEDDLDKTIEISEDKKTSDIRRLLHVMVEHQVHHRGELVVYFRMANHDPPRRWND